MFVVIDYDDSEKITINECYGPFYSRDQAEDFAENEIDCLGGSSMILTVTPCGEDSI